MDPFILVFFFFFVIVIIPVISLAAALKKDRQRAAARKAEEMSRSREPYVKSAPHEGSPNRAPVRETPASPYIRVTPYVKAPEAKPAAPAERRPLEKTVMKKNFPEKPVADEDDCRGGSIHDGYHEGVTQFDKSRPAAVAGKLGSRLAEEDEKRAREQAAAENAKRAMERIGKLPPLAQGVVWSEILGKPKSEIA